MQADRSLVLPAGLGRCTGPLLPPGVSPLGLDTLRDVLARCPPATGAPTPLLVLLHGAGGTARQALDLVGDRPVAAVLAMLAPPSRAALLHGLGMQAQLPQPRLWFRRCGRRSGARTPTYG